MERYGVGRGMGLGEEGKKIGPRFFASFSAVGSDMIVSVSLAMKTIYLCSGSRLRGNIRRRTSGPRICIAEPRVVSAASLNSKFL